MSEHLRPPDPKLPTSDADEDGEQLRILNRSPHPYHRQSCDLLEPSERLLAGTSATATGFEGADPQSYISRPPFFHKDSTPGSESGTEADDEHFLKGLPAPKARLHKGLRGRNEVLSGSSTPFLSPALLEEEGRKSPLNLSQGSFECDKRGAADRSRRRKEVIRRSAEVLLLLCQGGLVASNRDAQPFLRLHRKELLVLPSVIAALTALYPLRLVTWAYRQGKPSKSIPIKVPASFDLAPLLYPALIPTFVSLLVAHGVRGVVPVNVVLALSTLPRPLIPGARHSELISYSHWLLTCVPCFLEGYSGPSATSIAGPSSELLSLLYPLHQSLCLLLQELTTTSLLVAELQLLSVALINILLLATSPQVVILKSLLWGGGLALIVLCGQVISWGISLARVPKWRFRRTPIPPKGNSTWRRLRRLWPLGRARSSSVVSKTDIVGESDYSTDAFVDGLHSNKPQSFFGGPTLPDGASDGELAPLSRASTTDAQFLGPSAQISPRRHTFAPTGKTGNQFKGTTPSGRRKRSASYSVRAFFSLTQSQATLRKWAYAGYVYVCIIGIILVGIRTYVQHFALAGHEPIGWALGYLFGDLPRFRFEVVKANLEKWICLPPRLPPPSCCSSGWVQHVRLASLGAANTRLVLSAYWLGVLALGLAVVLRLSPVYEVDTRRKVFHFMMVAMFLPATFVDPAYVSLALALALAVFLLVDLVRASQLPPLSKPIAAFLTPYVDGRDLRGPVVISHIFLLIGCAIPLWLSLAALPRAGGPGALEGWEVPTRDVSMVAGVVCVGLGDAAASLIGRRWGHRKWLWGGGKSIEGSVAFATAVFVGLMAANTWLRVGEWPLTSPVDKASPLPFGLDAAGGDGLARIATGVWSWLLGSGPVQKTALCASVASLTEAVLTGGNDNVVVPVVLWTCVRAVDL
ncbi:hypothetical protein QBC39DRAFT_262654 [Podospora conica]|nr:hypothetical protein QBC39DRAFT_262654 [Schizothecium conicum]